MTGKQDPDESGAARFLFFSPEFRVEFRGSDEFVREQVMLVTRRILTELCGGEFVPQAPDPAAPATGKTPAPSGLEEFYLLARTREGRGALQDSILIFAHYMQKHQGKHEFTIEDLNFCFDLLNIQRPKSLANTLGILKRDRKLLHSGSRRGTYTLAERGAERVRRLMP